MFCHKGREERKEAVLMSLSLQKTHTRQCPGTPSACAPPPPPVESGGGGGGGTDSGSDIGGEVVAGLIVAAICAVAGVAWAFCRQRMGCAPRQAGGPMMDIHGGQVTGNINVVQGNIVNQNFARGNSMARTNSVQACPKCQTIKVDASARFCRNCGNPW